MLNSCDGKTMHHGMDTVVTDFLIPAPQSLKLRADKIHEDMPTRYSLYPKLKGKVDGFEHKVEMIIVTRSQSRWIGITIAHSCWLETF
jgi:hypothetical protein